MAGTLTPQRMLKTLNSVCMALEQNPNQFRTQNAINVYVREKLDEPINGYICTILNEWKYIDRTEKGYFFWKATEPNLGMAKAVLQSYQRRVQENKSKRQQKETTKKVRIENGDIFKYDKNYAQLLAAPPKQEIEINGIKFVLPKGSTFTVEPGGKFSVQL